MAENLVLTQDELAERYHLRVGTIRDWRAKGKGPAWFRAGKYARYRLADVLAWEADGVRATAESRQIPA